MMKTCINEIKENDNVDSLFLVKEKSSGVTKTGNAYLKLKLVDRTGEMEGRVWTSADILSESFEKDDFVHVKGKAVSFQDHLQLNVTLIEKVGEEEIFPSDFFPTTEKDGDGMFQTLVAMGQQIKDQYLRQLLDLFWKDESFVEHFKKAPASTRLHHTYLGGLLEHTLSVTQLALMNATHYSELNLDLLLAASTLHDLGKVDELTYQRSFDYSDEGRLLGHIIIGIEKVENKIRQIPDFPVDLATQLKHLLISHHGQYIWGSPKKPMTLEAIMLHYLDDMDAKMNGIQQFLRTQIPVGSKRSAYHPVLEQFFYSSSRAVEIQPTDNIQENESDEG
jgi:3'-5' exoribonuclease